MKIKYIFFDFDGVLAESVNIKTEAFKKMYQKYGDSFSEKVKDHHIKNGGVSRFEKFKIYNGEWLGQVITDSKIDQLAKEFSKLVIDGVINANEVKGASSFLEQSNDYEKFIITGTPTDEINLILEGRNMREFFLEVGGSPQSKDYWVRKILRERNISPNSCVFVGDALADYSAAKSNNIEFILRETKEGIPLFRDFKGYRIKDMTFLKGVVSSIEKSNS